MLKKIPPPKIVMKKLKAFNIGVELGKAIEHEKMISEGWVKSPFDSEAEFVILECDGIKVHLLVPSELVPKVLEGVTKGEGAECKDINTG